jgi:hypothetical protein
MQKQRGASSLCCMTRGSLACVEVKTAPHRRPPLSHPSMSLSAHDDVLSLGTASPSSTMSEFIVEEPTKSTTAIDEPIA